ncbi:hypothetical protein LZC95_41770 [Pendulispora brunnea]|uniref:VWA domain-containing protein n=1 Tax=Pendulispora brunnea TaxID=2905690 RepID=A0ABZ2K2W1_9BACT
MRQTFGGLLLLSLVYVAAGGCLTRPVVHIDPTDNASFTKRVFSSAIDKIDLLFMIDNSASMGDKQEYLRAAIPDLLQRLVTPMCIDEKDPKKVVGPSKNDGQCPAGSKVEFPPVRDMHIGVVTSSLGKRLGNNDCDPASDGSNGLSLHKDDAGHLINRAGPSQVPIEGMKPSNFLAWFPKVEQNKDKSAGPGAVPVESAKTLQEQFQDEVEGIGQLGCGIESQLESWYRFLIQPDPYERLELDGEKKATWVGVDTTILKQRRDFLRPDSLVAVIALSDENDSEIDVRSSSGNGYQFMDSNFGLFRGTATCTTNPDDPNCKSCGRLDPAARDADPNCRKGLYVERNDWGQFIGVRHVHMKQKYGFDPQFPISRYVNGLRSPRVPDRTGEYPTVGNYVGDANCQNPLFAAVLPDGSDVTPATLCNLPPGPRTKELVFYAHIGGVPANLLHYDPNDLEKSRLSVGDWTKILGRDPEHYDYSGIDPHMIESYAPRPEVGHPETEEGNGSDPVHGREWITNTGERNPPVDRQFACTFDRVDLKTGSPSALDCTKAPDNQICDCPSNPNTPRAQVPPVCDPQDVTKQIKAKAYPTIRELQLARLMENQGVVSSICPIHVRRETEDDPLFGYRPAVATIVDRLKDALLNQCLPRQLQIDEGQVACLVLEMLPKPGDASQCDNPAKGLKRPDPKAVKSFLEEEMKTWRAAGAERSGRPDPSTLPICEVIQLPANVDCSKGEAKAGWCYVEGGRCGQAILFSKEGNPPSGALTSLQCIDARTDGGAP